jgi:hypothetical protein
VSPRGKPPDPPGGAQRQPARCAPQPWPGPVSSQVPYLQRRLAAGSARTRTLGPDPEGSRPAGRDLHPGAGDWDRAPVGQDHCPGVGEWDPDADTPLAGAVFAQAAGVTSWLLTLSWPRCSIARARGPGAARRRSADRGAAGGERAGGLGRGAEDRRVSLLADRRETDGRHTGDWRPFDHVDDEVAVTLTLTRRSAG